LVKSWPRLLAGAVPRDAISANVHDELLEAIDLAIAEGRTFLKSRSEFARVFAELGLLWVTTRADLEGGLAVALWFERKDHPPRRPRMNARRHPPVNIPRSLAEAIEDVVGKGGRDPFIEQFVQWGLTLVSLKRGRYDENHIFHELQAGGSL
jgi:hypothetical protein